MITTARYFATRLIGDFCRAHPEIEFALEVVNREQILERMRQNLDDLYIMGQVPDDLEVVAAPFAENPLVVLAPSGHPLAGEKTIAPARLEARAVHPARAGLGNAPGDGALFRRAQDPPARRA